MQTFSKSRVQFWLERTVPAVLTAIITIGYFLDGHGWIGALALIIGMLLIVAIFAEPIPLELILNQDVLTIVYNRGNNLVVPYKNIQPSIVNIQRLLLRAKDENGKKINVGLGAYWRQNGASVTNITVIQAIEQASKRDFNY